MPIVVLAPTINELFQDIDEGLPMIMVINRIDLLIGRSDQYSTDFASQALWANIERQKGKNFFLIGLMNLDANLSKHFQSRSRLSTIVFPSVDLKKKVKLKIRFYQDWIG